MCALPLGGREMKHALSLLFAEGAVSRALGMVGGFVYNTIA